MTPQADPVLTNDSQAAVELEKLRLEVAELRWKVRWFYKIGQIISIVSASIAVLAFVVSLYQYNRQQRENAWNNQEARDRELKKPVWEKQLGVAFEISNVAAEIATTIDPDNEARKRAEARFWQLYYGPAIFVEDENLKQAMIHFGECLVGGEGCGSEAEQSSRLPELSLDLTNQCRKVMGVTWQLGLQDLYKNRVQSTPAPLP